MNECNFYDVEEIYSDCTVQILRNSVTGCKSIGWWRNDAPPIGMCADNRFEKMKAAMCDHYCKYADSSGISADELIDNYCPVCPLNNLGGDD